MRVCANSDSLNGRGWRLLVLGIVCAGIVGYAAAAGFSVDHIEPREAGRSLDISGAVTLELSPQVQEAIGNGIPVEFVIDMRLYRRRALIWDETLQSWRIRRRLNYHALSGQYLLSGEGVAPSHGGYPSLEEALRQSGQLDELTLPLAQSLVAGGDYRLGVRVSLDIEALPPLLRPVAYTSRAWDLNSGWTTWKVLR